MVGSVLTLVTLLFSGEDAAAQTYTQMQWGMNKGVTPYAFGANINGNWRDLGTVSAAGAWSLGLSNLTVSGAAIFSGSTTIPFTQTGVGAVPTTVDAKLKTMPSVKDFGAIGDGGTHPLSERYATLAAAQAVYPFVTSLAQTIDWAAIQAATNTISSGRGTVYIPKGVYITKDEIDCSSNSYDMLAYEGDAAQTYVRNYAASPMATFNCSGSVFKVAALSFKNIALWYPTNTAAGSIGVKLVNRQETYFDHMSISGYYNGIVLTTSWAPRINNSVFSDHKAAAVTTTDSSFKGASITNNTFFGNGIVASKAALELSSPNGAIISGNDFSTNYRHISFQYAVGVSVNGNYFENTPSYTPSFVFSTSNAAINFTGNTIQWSTGNVFENVEGLSFNNNHLYGAQFTTASTAKQVSYAGNNIQNSVGPVIVSSLAAPTYETASAPMLMSSGFSGSKYQINGVDAVTLISNFHTIQAPDGLGGSAFVGNISNLYRNDTHTFQNKAWSSTFAQINSTQISSNIPIRAGVYTIATLPTCSATILGAKAVVSNGTDYATGTYGSAVSATGAVSRSVFCTNTTGATTYAWAYN
jgi:hypothetical protein